MRKYVEKASGATLEIVAEDQLAKVKSGGRVFVGPCLAAKRVVDIKSLQPEGLEAIGGGDAAARERVRLVETGLEYTKKTRDLLAAAAARRAGKCTRDEFNILKAETDKFCSTLSGGLAVRVSHDVQSCLR